MSDKPNPPPKRPKRDNLRAILFNMPEHMIAELDLLSRFKGTNRTALINIVLSDWLNQELKVLTENGRIEELGYYANQTDRVKKLRERSKEHFKKKDEDKDLDIRKSILGEIYDD